ncbi:MAG: MG2 domain-containing protein, partial [Draconibacterium sp.]
MKKLLFPFVIVLIFFLTGCQSNKKEDATDVAFGRYVQAFTSGTISTEANITVYLAQPVSEKLNEDEQLFSFKPAISGKTVLVGNRIVEFRPSEPLKAGISYSAQFCLGKILKTEKKMETMPFSFSTIKQSFSVTLDGLRNYGSGSPGKMQFTGYMLTADVANPAEAEKVVTATYEGNEVALHWTHDVDRRKHFFTIDSLQRAESNSRELVISWDGKPLDVDKKEEEKIEVPAMNVFNILDAKVVQEPEQYIQIEFSDPVQKNQDLTGLITLADGTELRLTTELNVIKAYPANQLSGEIDLTVFEGIQNINYAKIKEQQTFRLQFSSIKPAVRLIGKGVIVPQNTTLEMPFEAVSLNAVEVRIVQIFKNNILQFFQDNQFDNDSELKKVGRLVYSGKIPLNGEKPGDLLRWRTYKVNLANLITIEQGAIYNVQFRFKKEFSLYNCGEEKEESTLEETEISTAEPYQTEWDEPGWYYDYYYPPGFEWDERENPCHVSYYTNSHFVSRNIFASELGIIAKEGRNHVMDFAVTNLRSTNPESGVELKLFNYQNQLIETVTTDNSGFAKVDLKKKPFLLVAQKGKQFGYLRLDDGSALSTSNFNISGEVITDGLKGFIYGERGVWRPGDTLFLNLIVEKENAQFPEDYPVIFQLINPNGQVVEKLVQTENMNGFYSFKIKTESDAPTGNWRAEAKVGNAVFSQRVKIETVKPNRLKVDLKLPEKALTLDTKSIPLESMWLFGSPARSLKTKVDVLFVEDKTKFEGFEKYSFSDPATKFSPEEQTVFEGKLDENGKVTIPVDFESLKDAPGMVKAWFTSRV